MTTIEHLNKIKVKCEQLLAIAEKRTPGKWEASDNVVFADATDGYYMATFDGPKTSMAQDACNAAFLTFCAGPAEAGWRATIAAIDDILTVDQDLPPEVQNITTEMFLYVNGNLVQSILSAWPEELLN